MTIADIVSPEFGVYIFTTNGRKAPRCIIHEIVPIPKSNVYDSYIRVGYTSTTNRADFYIHKSINTKSHNYMAINLTTLVKDESDPGTMTEFTTEPTGITYFNWKIYSDKGLQTS